MRRRHGPGRRPASNASGVRCFEADEDGVVGRSLLDEDPVDAVVVAPRRSRRRRGITGDEADDVAEERRRTPRGRRPALRGRRLRAQRSWWRSCRRGGCGWFRCLRWWRRARRPGRGSVAACVSPPTPDGVPVKMRSPGSNGVIDDRWWTSASTPKIRSDVRLFCISSPLTVQPSARSSGSSSSSGVTTQGPIGPNPGNDLPRLNCGAGGPGLHDPLGQVLTDGEAGDVRPPLAQCDLVGAPADHDHELDLPVDELARQLDGGVRPGEAGRELGERRRERRGARGPPRPRGRRSSGRWRTPGGGGAPAPGAPARRVVLRARSTRVGQGPHLVPALDRAAAGSAGSAPPDAVAISTIPLVEDQHGPSVGVGDSHRILPASAGGRRHRCHCITPMLAL